MTLVTFSQVVARYVFNTGVVWALELTVYLFAWLVLFGMSYGVKVHAHLGIDAFVKLFSSRAQRVFGLLAVAAGLIYGAILLIGSWQYVWKLFQIGIESEDLPIPQWVPMAILPIGLALLLFRLARGRGADLARRAALAACRRGAADDQGFPRSSGPGAGRARGARRCRRAAAMTIAFLFVTLFALLLIGAPIAIALGLSAVATILLFSNDSLASLALKLFETMQHYTLLAIPFFILSSAFLTTGGVARAHHPLRHGLRRPPARRLRHGGRARLHAVRRGLAARSPATVVAIGSIVIAGMVRAGYSKEFAAGVICNAGTLGILIPPSIVMVVYGAATNTSVGRLFIAGVIPGIVAGLMLMIGDLRRRPLAEAAEPAESAVRRDRGLVRDAVWGLLLRRHHHGRHLRRRVHADRGGRGRRGLCLPGRGVRLPRHRPAQGPPGVAPGWARLERSTVASNLPLVAPLATFAGGLAQSVVYLPATLVHKDVKHVMVEAGPHHDHADVHHRERDAVRPRADHRAHPAHHHRDHRRGRARALVVPDRGQHPAADRRQLHGAVGDPPDHGADPVPDRDAARHRSGAPGHHHGGEHGDRLITPPVGLNLFVTSGITNMSVLEVVRAALPWLGILFLFLILVTYIPIISTFLPDLLYGPLAR